MFFLKNTISLISFISLSYAAYCQDTPPAAFPGDAKLNYVRTWEAIMPQINKDSMKVGDSSQVKQVTQYFDGLGRLIETVLKKANPRGVDIITANTYDASGRETHSYLPYTSHWFGTGDFYYDPFNTIQTWYISNFNDSFSYSKTLFERSPLGRPVTTYAPGKNWVGASRGTQMQYLFNTVDDSVRKWAISGSQPVTSARYGAGQLEKNVNIDEHGKQVIEYKDAQGRLILKKVQLDNSPAGAHLGWLCTYYVYNDMNELSFVLQPKAIEQLISNSWTFSGNTLNELCFMYVYDERHRMTIKRVPGAGEVWMVYDARNRLVMEQDSVQRFSGKWLVTQYDKLDRPMRLYLWTNGSTRASHQSSATGSTSYPTLSGTYELLTENYRDNYDWVSGTGLSSAFISTYSGNTSYFYTASNTSWPYAQSLTPIYRNTGMITGSKTKVLGTSTYLYTVSFYDEKGSMIQTQNTNYTGGKDTVTMQYSYDGKMLRNLLCHEKGGSNALKHIMLTKMEYDAAGRISKVIKKSGNSPETIIAQNSYTELGQLKQKKIGQKRDGSNQNTYTNAPLDSLAYTYNIRNWMTSINIDYAKGNNNNNYFGMQLGFDTGFTQLQYNGNISGTRWRNKGDGERRMYEFTYDAANRITAADFKQYTSGSWSTSAGVDFSLSNMTYDVNGNILTMQQKGLKVVSSSTIDNLQYNYLSNSNKLNYVTDQANDTTSLLGDFKEYKNNTTQDYSYDGNGSMTVDSNKRISTIIYNYLNLPDSIRITGKGTIKYTYDAAGIKLKKTTVDSTGESVVIASTLYVNGFEYLNDTLQHIVQDEGRIRPKGNNSSDTMYYDYFEKDHLGNIRVMITDELKTDAYPPASMETASATLEESLYARLPECRSSFPPNYPTGDTYTNPNDYTARVRSSYGDWDVGPSIVLRVMAGDKFNLRVSSWWQSNGVDPATPTTSVLSNLVAVMAGGIVKQAPGKYGQNIDIIDNDWLEPGLTDYLNTQSGYNSSRPKAFINWILLDDQFKLVSSSSGFEQVRAESEYFEDKTTPIVYVHTQNDMPINKNGFLFIYVSNETPNIPVYYDNLQVTHIRGPLLSTGNYYPFGLTMAGISTKAASFLENKKKWNFGSELNSDLDINLYETFYRSLDPQIGRFWQIDTKPNYLESLYSSMGNNPILKNDPLGDTLVNSNDVKAAASTRKELNNKKDGLQTKVNANLTKALQGIFGSDKMTKGEFLALESSTNELGQMLNEVKTSITDLDNIIADKNNGYTFRSGASSTDISINDNKNIVIDIGDFDLTVHEIRHASKFASGQAVVTWSEESYQWAWTYRKGMTEMNAEIDSYRAQYSVNPNEMPPSTGNRVTKLGDIKDNYVRNIFDKDNPTVKPYKNLR